MTTDLHAWAERLRAEVGGKLQARLRQAMLELAMDAQGEAQDNIRSRFERGGVRTGSLHRSIAGQVREVGGHLEAVASAGGRTGGRDVPYAGIHEVGGVIRPKRGKWLAIPMPPVLTTAGVARGGPRDYELRFVPVSGSRAWLVRDAGRGKTARTEPMFLLVRRVQIRGKHYLRDAMQAALGRVDEPFRSALTLAVEVP